MTNNDKTNGSSGGLGDEETTPALPRREPSPEATALRNLGLALNAVERDCGASASIVDELEGDERHHALVSLAFKLGQLGDLAFEARRIVRDLAMNR
jgi:hypothetical protein